MSVYGRDVISLDKFKQYINVKDNLQDDFLRTLLDEAFSFAEGYTNRTLGYELQSENFHIDDGVIGVKGRYYYVRLSVTPVDISRDINLYYDGSSTANNDYKVRVTSEGLFVFSSLPDDYITVEYYGGYASKTATQGVHIPDDLEYAIIVLAATMWNEKKGALGLKAVKLGDEEIQVLEDDIPRRAKRVLDKYKRFVI